MPQGHIQILTSGAPPRRPRPGQLLLTHGDRQPDGFEVLEMEIADTEMRLKLMRQRLAKLRSRAKKRRPSMAAISKLEPI